MTKKIVFIYSLLLYLKKNLPIEYPKKLRHTKFELFISIFSKCILTWILFNFVSKHEKWAQNNWIQLSIIENKLNLTPFGPNIYNILYWITNSSYLDFYTKLPSKWNFLNFQLRSEKINKWDPNQSIYRSIYRNVWYVLDFLFLQKEWVFDNAILMIFSQFDSNCMIFNAIFYVGYAVSHRN